MIPYGRQWIDEDDIEAVARALRSDWLTTGPEVEAFERDLAEYTGARYAVVFSSGTAALHGAYFAAGIGPGDAILTSPVTFAATANAARFLGADVVFADVDRNTVNLDPASARERLDRRVKAIVPVDFAGHPADMDAFRQLASDTGSVLISDACHSLGATYRGRPVGMLADMTVFSFHPVKGITTGEGGAVVTDDRVFYRRLVQFRNHGIERDPEFMADYHGPWYHEMQLLGFNYRLTDIQCALGRSQLAKLPRFLDRRREIAARYTEAFERIEGVTVPAVMPDVQPAWHLYVLRLDPDLYDRRAVFEALRERGLGVQVHYIPVYWHPYYRSLGYARGLCPVAEDYYRRCISIPLYPALDESEVQYVIRSVRSVLEAHRK
ncbi:UDP-4-amino-4,6-dideoxy-N-acetyl-beta-L-altrosamine transaminase [Caldinitratiruptor microaerophilus]|nr:UDP-4-amino-4,6-dideoxy-N-acetyl-beta-L-altrosamine transaminase [Caldinitratiruptor microaerophilus]